MKRSIAATLIVGMLSASPAMAAHAFLSPEQVHVERILPPPPAAGSVLAADDLAAVRAAVGARSAAQAERAGQDADDETGGYFGSVLGPAFDLTKLPKTAQLLGDVGETEEVIAKDAKAYFHRDRPYVVIADLATCRPHKPGPAPHSYPSGHATRSFAMAIVLAELIPSKAQAILARAADYSENRVICGAHFPSDIVAGQALGTAIAADLPLSGDFRTEYDAAKAELTAAGF